MSYPVLPQIVVKALYIQDPKQASVRQGCQTPYFFLIFLFFLGVKIHHVQEMPWNVQKTTFVSNLMGVGGYPSIFALDYIDMI